MTEIVKASRLKIRPLFDQIVLSRVEPVVDPDQLIVEPDAAKEKPTECWVVRVGPGKGCEDCGRLRRPSVGVGQRVLIKKYAGSEATIGGREYVIVLEHEILGVLEEE
jgi:chaperonin GroES